MLEFVRGDDPAVPEGERHSDSTLTLKPAIDAARKVIDLKIMAAAR